MSKTFQQQIATSTQLNRHLPVLRALRDLPALSRLGRPPRILSFGCSTGHELLDIASVFPSAELLGCDIHEGALAEASDRCAGVAEVFASSEEALLQRGPLDLVIAFNVLCRYPQTSGLDDISQVYPFLTMEAALQALDRCLPVGGVLAIYNCPYFFEDSGLGTRYLPSGSAGFQRNGWMEKCDPNGRRVDRVRFSHDGRVWERKEYFEGLRSGLVHSVEAAQVYHEWLPLPDCRTNRSFTEVAWIRSR